MKPFGDVLIKNIGRLAIKDDGNYIVMMIGYETIDIELTIGPEFNKFDFIRFDRLVKSVTFENPFKSIRKFVDIVLSGEYEGYADFEIYSLFSNFTKDEIYKFVKYCE